MQPRHVVSVALIALTATLGCSKFVASSSRSGSSGSASSGSVAAGAAAAVASIEVLDPAPAAWLTTPDLVLLGRAVSLDGAGVAAVDVSGAPATLQSDGTFTAPIHLETGLNTLTIAVTKTDGRVSFKHVSYMCGPYRDPTIPMQDAVNLRINPQTIPVWNAVIAEELGNLDFGQVLRDVSPVYANSWLFGVVSVRIDIPDAVHSGLTTGLSLTNSGVHARLRFNSVNAQLTARDQGGFTIPVNIQGNLHAQSLEADAPVTLSLAADGTPVANVGATNVTVNGLSVNVTNGAVTNFIVNLLTSRINDLLEDVLRDLVETEFTRLINEQLAVVNQEHVAPVGNTSLTIRFQPSQLDVSTAGLFVRSAASLVAAPTPLNASAPGVASTTGIAPGLPTQKGFYATFDDDAVNMLLHAAWQGGLLDIETLPGGQIPTAPGAAPAPTLPLPGTVGGILTILPELAGRLPNSTPLVIRIRPDLPPWICPSSSNTSACSVHLGETHLEILADMGGGALQRLIDVTAHIDFPLNVSMQQSSLSLSSLSSQATYLFDVVDEPLVRFNHQRVQLLLSIVFDASMPQLLAAAQGIPIPFPGGLEIVDFEFLPDGPSGDHLTISGNIRKR